MKLVFGELFVIELTHEPELHNQDEKAYEEIFYLHRNHHNMDLH